MPMSQEEAIRFGRLEGKVEGIDDRLDRIDARLRNIERTPRGGSNGRLANGRRQQAAQLGAIGLGGGGVYAFIELARWVAETFGG